MNYYAYGSNMSSDYIREFCPSARFVRRAQLPNYRIEFRRYSTDLKGGISTIMAAPGDLVHDIMIAGAREHSLDRRYVAELAKLRDS